MIVGLHLNIGEIKPYTAASAAELIKKLITISAYLMNLPFQLFVCVGFVLSHS